MKRKNSNFLRSPLNPARPSRRKRLAALLYGAWGMM